MILYDILAMLSLISFDITYHSKVFLQIAWAKLLRDTSTTNRTIPTPFIYQGRNMIGLSSCFLVKASESFSKKYHIVTTSHSWKPSFSGHTRLYSKDYLRRIVDEDDIRCTVHSVNDDGTLGNTFGVEHKWYPHPQRMDIAISHFFDEEAVDEEFSKQRDKDSTRDSNEDTAKTFDINIQKMDEGEKLNICGFNKFNIFGIQLPWIENEVENEVKALKLSDKLIEVKPNMQLSSFQAYHCQTSGCVNIPPDDSPGPSRSCFVYPSYESQLDPEWVTHGMCGGPVLDAEGNKVRGILIAQHRKPEQTLNIESQKLDITNDAKSTRDDGSTLKDEEAVHDKSALDLLIENNAVVADAEALSKFLSNVEEGSIADYQCSTLRDDLKKNSTSWIPNISKKKV